MNISDDDIMIVFCDGPPDNDGRPTHERRAVKTYVRKFDGGFFWSAIAGADDPRPKPSKGWKLRFHCRLCGLDEKRSAGVDRKDGDGVYQFTSRISEIFEPLHAIGTHEVDVRLLVKWL